MKERKDEKNNKWIGKEKERNETKRQRKKDNLQMKEIKDEKNNGERKI
jgi:hypothetical protein